MASRSSLASGFQSPPATLSPWVKHAALLILLAVLPVLSWWGWKATHASSPSNPIQDALIDKANGTVATTPTAAGLPAEMPLPGPAASAPDKAPPASPPSENLAQAPAPNPSSKNTLSIKGLGFITLDVPEKPAPRQKEIEPKARINVKPSEQTAAPTKGGDPCQDINRKLSTQDPTPEDIAFLKRGCK